MNKAFSKLLFSALLVFSIGVFAGKPVNVNKADAKLLSESLDGIGEVKAKKIVEYREKFKVSFKTLKDLEKVSGVGEKTLQENAKYIQF